MPRNILIDPQRLGSANPNIQFSGSMANTIRLEVLTSGSVQFTGVSGSLLSITDSLSGSLFAVSDVSGLPILETFSDDRVVMGRFNTNALVVTGSFVGVGTNGPLTPFHVRSSILDMMLIEQTNDSTWNRIYFKKPSRNWTLGQTNGSEFVISDETAGAYRFIVNNLGNVGIGTDGAAETGVRLVVSGGLGNIRIGQVYPTYNGITLNGSTSQNDYNFLSRTTDQTLFINRPSGNSIQFREANVTQATISSGGNVGIGITANASYKLHVNGSIAAWDGTNGRAVLVPSNSSVTGYIEWRNGSSTRLGYMGGGSATNLNINVENSANLIIDGGNVGIGTSLLDAKLVVNGNSVFSGSVLPDGDLTRDLGSATYRWRTLFAANISGSLTPAGATAGSVFFAGDSGQISQDNANLFWDDANDRLGIGTASPGFKLDVAGASGVGIRLIENSTGNNNRLVITQTGTLTSYQATFSTGTAQQAWLIGNTEAMRLDASGNLGIGTVDANGNRLAISGGNLSVTGSVLPGATTSYDLGSTTYRWAELYVRTGSFSGDVSIAGNLTVLGVQTYVSSTVVDIGDNIITLNSTANPQRYGGLYINDTTANTTGSLLWDSDNNYWVAGLKGSEAILPTGTGTTNYVTKWGTASTLTNSTIFDNGTNVAIGINAANSVGLTVYNSGTPTVSLKNSTTGNGSTDGLQLSIAGSESYVWNYEAGAIRFGTNATERLVIDSSGNVGVGTTFPMGGLDLRKLDIQHNGYTTAVVNTLTTGTTGSFRYEIARVGIDYNDWNQVGSIEVELLEKYWSQGSRKKYIIWYGYTSNSGVYLTEVSGPESAQNMENYQLTIGSEVSVAGDQRYIPVYVDVQYYTYVTAVIRTNRTITATNPPPIGTMWINKSPSGVSLTPAFTPSTYVYLNNIGGYSSVFKYGYVGIGSSTPALALDILHSVPQIRVKGTSTTTEVRLNSSWAGTALGAVGTVDAGPFMIYTSNSERVRFDTSGNVGIGSTTTSGVRLHVSDNQSSATARFQLANVNANGGPLRIGYFPDSAGFHITANGNPSHTNVASNTVTRDYTNRAAFEMLNVLGSTLAGSYFDFRYSQSTTFSPAMRFQGDGKVGIGTTTFSSTETVAALEVSGSVYIQQNTDNDIKKLQFISNVSNTSLASFESKRLANYGSEFRLQIGRSAGGTGAQNVWKSRIYDDPTSYPNQNTHTTFNMTDTGGSNSNGVDATAVVYIGNGSNAGNTRPSLYTTNDAYFAVSRGGVGIGTTVTNGNVLAITGSTAITGSVLPGVDNLYDLGSASKRWANLYVNNLTFASVTALLTGSNLSNGSVLFANATGGITGSQTQLFWNNTNNRLGIGNSTPNNPLTVVGNVDFRQSTASGNYLQFVPGTSYALISSNVGIEITAGGNYFVADANGYLFRNTAGSINNAFIDSSTGNVGVGSTTTLAARLQVSGSSTASTSTMLVKEGVASPTGGALAFEVEKSNGSTIFSVSGSGFVGIGTSIPNATFEVVGVSGSLFSVTDQLSGSLFSVNTISGLPILEVFSDNTVVAGAYNSNALVVTGSRVGIATNNPDQRLDVRGNIGFGRRAQATVTRYVGLTNTDGNFSSTGGTGTTGIIIDQHSGGDTSVRFKTGAWGVSEDIRMSIDRVGNVGIGTTVATNASYAFSAGGGLSIYNGTQATIRLSAPSSNWDIGSNTNSLYFYDATNTSERMRIDGSGYVYIGGVSTRLASEVVRIGKASTQNSILLNNTAVDNAAIVGVFNDAAALAVNRNTSTGGFVNTGKYAAEVYAVGSASTSYVSIATAAAANTTPTERLRVDASGNLTIGPAVGTAAQSLIHLMTTATGDVPRITFTNATTGHTSGDGAFVGIANNTQLCVWNKESSDILFAANNTERMRIDAAGNVGIGTNNTNSNKVAISGGNLSVTGSVLPGVDNTYDLGTSSYRWRTIFAANISGSLTPTGATAGSVFFAGASGQIAQDNANFFWDNTNSRLGIGTSSPGQKLDVIGNVRASSTLLADTGATIGTNSLASLLSVIANAAAGQYKGFGFQSAGSYRWYLTSNNTAEGGSNAGSDLEVRAYADAGTYLSSPLLIKRSTGNVGINTTSPGSRLTIGTDFASVAGITVDTGGAGDSALIVRRAVSKPAFSILPWDTEVYLTAGVYYDGTTWTHHSNSTNSQLFTMNPSNGVIWYASSDGSASWNLAGGVTLWDNGARWKSSVQSTRAENSYFTGGSVGIGTSTIVAYSGYTVLDIDSTTNGGLLNLKKNGSTVGYINAVSGLQVLASSGNNMYLTVAGANALYIRTNATDRMLVDSSGNLTPYLDNTYNLGSSTLRWANVHAVNIISSGSLGPSYTSPSSTSGGTAIYDTVSVTTNGAVYELMIIGNPNSNGDANYRDIVYGKIIIGTGYSGAAVKHYIQFVNESPAPRSLYGSGGGPLTADVVYLQSGTEYTDIAQGGTATIRVKVSGYNSGAGGIYVGNNTTVRLKQVA